MLDRRDEAIVDPDLPIIDAHHHLFDRPALRYLLNEYLADIGTGHRIMGSVYVETQAPSPSCWTVRLQLHPIACVAYARSRSKIRPANRIDT